MRLILLIHLATARGTDTIRYPDFDRANDLTYKSLNESAYRLADPLRHLGIDLALHQTWSPGSAAAYLRRHSLCLCLGHPDHDYPRARSALATQAQRVAGYRRRWFTAIQSELRLGILGRAAHPFRSCGCLAIYFSRIWAGHRALLSAGRAHVREVNLRRRNGFFGSCDCLF